MAEQTESASRLSSESTIVPAPATAAHSSRYGLLALGAIVLLAAFLRLYELGRDSLWFDEAFSASIASWQPRWIITKTVELGLRFTDRNIFHLLLHYVLQWGQTEVAVRIISVVSGVLSVVALYALGKRLMGQSVALLAAFLLAISPYHVWYSREGRNYALLVLIGLLASYFMLRALDDDRRRSWLGYIALAGLSAYTHTFGILLIGALNLFAIVRLIVRRSPPRRLRAWFVAQVVLAILIYPMESGFTSQGGVGWGGWIGEKHGIPTLSDLVHTMGIYSFGTAYDHERLLYVVGLLVFALPCLAELFTVVRARRRERWWPEAAEPLLFALVCLVVPIALLWLVSHITPLFLERYLRPFLPPYLLIVAAGVMSIRRPDWRALLFICLLIVIVPSLLSVYQDSQKEDWRGGAAFVAAEANADDMIVIYDAYASMAFDFYYHDASQQVLISRFADDEEMTQHAQTIAARQGRVWLVLSHADDERMLRFVDSQQGVRRVVDEPFQGLRIVAYETGAGR